MGRQTAAPQKEQIHVLERSYEPEVSDVEGELVPSMEGSARPQWKSPSSNLAQPVQDLMRLIFNEHHIAEVMADMHYDAEKLPLGKLSKRTMALGYEALERLADVLRDPRVYGGASSAAYNETIHDCTNAYYTYIPHNFGFVKPPLILDDKTLEKEIELVQTLSEMTVTEEIMNSAKRLSPDGVHSLDRQYDGLKLQQMTLVDPSSREFKELEGYLCKSRGDTHGIIYKKIQAIFRIARQDEYQGFEKSVHEHVNCDRRLLWHGSRTTNFGGILSQGLRIAPPEAPVSGYVSTFHRIPQVVNSD